MKAKIILLFFVLLSFSLFSCEKVDEVPPRTKGYSSQKFKIPTPSLLNQQEKTEVEAIKKEYYEAIAN